jgi:hypothetical protein
MFFAGDTEGTFRSASGSANLRQVQRFVGVCLQILLELRDDLVVTTTAAGHLNRNALGQAPDQYMGADAMASGQSGPPKAPCGLYRHRRGGKRSDDVHRDVDRDDRRNVVGGGPTRPAPSLPAL